MGSIGQSANDYLESLKALAPKGVCWTTDNNSNWIKLLDAIAQEYARVDGRGVDLLMEAFPDTSDELLPNWERLVGLPDTFSDPDATIEERRQQVLFKLQARGGQTAEYIQDLIATLGYESLIIDATPFKADFSHADDFLFDDTWAHIFVVVVQNPVANHEQLEGRIRSIQPAQSKSIFFYVDDINDF